MTIKIPCVPGGQSNWVQRTAIEGRDYILSFDWIQRDGAWYLSIADQDGAAIASGIKLVSQWPLLRGVTDSRCPKGELLLLDSTGASEDAGFSDLGVRFELVYFTAGELAELAS